MLNISLIIDHRLDHLTGSKGDEERERERLNEKGRERDTQREK
jgi:hypothetical protein